MSARVLSGVWRRRVRWAAVGFALGAGLTAALFVHEGATEPHFEALYGGPRPTGAGGSARWALVYLEVYLLAGAVGALLGLVASFARPRRRASSERAV